MPKHWMDSWANSCCKHGVDRHAYNGCADCGCGVTWSEHPDRSRDFSNSAMIARVNILRRLLKETIELAKYPQTESNNEEKLKKIVAEMESI